MSDKSFTFSLKPSDKHTLVEVVPMPDNDEFVDFAHQFVVDQQGELVVIDSGLDRHQCRYTIGDHQYVLNYEFYTDSIWLEQDY